jgi:hypothetical protein
VPQFTQGILVDASALVRCRQAAGDRLSYMDFPDAMVRAAQAVPDVLARLVDQRAVLRHDRRQHCHRHRAGLLDTGAA